MVMSAISAGQESLVTKKRVFTTITAALKRGYPVAYDRDRALDERGGTEAVTGYGSGRQRVVEQVSVANADDFAGWVAKDYLANALGQWIEIMTPVLGACVEVWANSACVINETILYPVPGAYTMASGPAFSPYAIKTVQTVDRSTTAGMVQGVVMLACAIPYTNKINVYETGATQKFPIGMRHVDPTDGRVFRYVKAGAALLAGFGAACAKGCVITGEAELLHANAAIGDSVVRISQPSITLNQFADGYAILGHGTAGHTMRRIVSNTASEATTDHVDITLEQPLTVALTTASRIDVMYPIYSGLKQGMATVGEQESFLGIPNIAIASGEYGWIQTWGPCYATPGGGTTPGDSANDRMVYFVGDGSVNGGAHLTYAGKAYQFAGFIIQPNDGLGNPPLVMLQISP